MNNDKNIARQIVLAQISSESGKGHDDLVIKEDRGPHRLGYGLKSRFIKNAINMINKSKESRISYWCVENPDQNGYPSIITYFLYRGPEGRFQVSFHTPYNMAGSLIPFIGKGMKQRWNKVIGGSHEACENLIEIFDL